MRILLLLILFVHSIGNACDLSVPIESKFESGKKPTKTEAGHLLILAPLKFEGWSVSGLQYAKGKNSIPVMQYVSELEFPGKAAFQIIGTSEFFNGAVITVSYTPDPIRHKNGSLSGTFCLHTQEVPIEI